jgi:hypothetical protein
MVNIRDYNPRFIYLFFGSIRGVVFNVNTAFETPLAKVNLAEDCTKSIRITPKERQN